MTNIMKLKFSNETKCFSLNLLIFNCSQKKFVAIIVAVVFLCFFMSFCLVGVLSDAFEFLSSKTGLTGNARSQLRMQFTITVLRRQFHGVKGGSSLSRTPLIRFTPLPRMLA